MKASRNLCAAFELVVALLALAFPKAFVTNTALALGSFPWGPENSIHYAYGLFLIFLFSVSSFIRKLGATGESKHPGIKAHWFSGLVVVGAVAIFYSILTSASGQVALEEIVTPFFSYLLSVVFCIGVGYAVSDLLSIFVSKE
jgi:hypothetical protein